MVTAEGFAGSLFLRDFKPLHSIPVWHMGGTFRACAVSLTTVNLWVGASSPHRLAACPGVALTLNEVPRR